MISGAEGPNFWKLAKAAAAVSIQPHGGDLWFGDAPFVHLTSGAVDMLTTVKQNTLTDGATSTRRPAYAEPAMTFDGTTDYLTGAANVASAAAEVTFLLEFSTSETVAPHFFEDYGPSGARGGFLLDVGNKINSYALGGGNVTEFSTATLNSARAVLSATYKASLGTAATVQPRINDASAGGSRTTSQDMTGQSLGAGNWSLGARAFDSSAPGQMVCSAGGIVLGQMTSQECDAYANAIRILRNLA